MDEIDIWRTAKVPMTERGVGAGYAAKTAARPKRPTISAVSGIVQKALSLRANVLILPQIRVPHLSAGWYVFVMQQDIL